MQTLKAIIDVVLSLFGSFFGAWLIFDVLIPLFGGENVWPF